MEYNQSKQSVIVKTYSNNDNVVYVVSFTFMGELPLDLVSTALRPYAVTIPPRPLLSEPLSSSESIILSSPNS